MTRKIIAFLMIAAVIVMSLAGCGSTENADTTPDTPDTSVVSSESDTPGILDIFGDMTASDSDFPEHAYSLQISDLDEAVLIVRYSEEYSDEPYAEEVSSYVWFGSPGMTIAQIMEEWDIESIEPYCEGYDLLGWAAYESILSVDENGWEEFTENELFDGRLFTTEEMLSLELTDTDIIFYTVWDLVCSECGEHKICTAYYLDEGRSFICDDCYETFAADFGF